MIQSLTLDQLPKGARGRIIAVDWPALAADDAGRLAALGLDIGAEVRLAFRGVMGARDPLAIEIGAMTVALRRAHARAMTVEAFGEAIDR